LKNVVFASTFRWNVLKELPELTESEQSYHELQSKVDQAIFREEGTTFITQAYAYAQHYISPVLMIFYGFHALHFELSDDFSPEPRGGLRWQPVEGRSVSVAFGKHSRVENLQYYLARDHQSGGNEVQINRNLRFTRADHYVLSFDQKLPKYHRMRIEAYYQKLYNTPVQTNAGSTYATINEESGFVTDTLINGGKGKNYGIEFTFEKNFHKDLYYILNGSVYTSTFDISNQEYRDINTAYNGNFMVHALAGKEYQVRSANATIGFNVKLTLAGGRPYVPIDLEQSIQEKRQIYSWDKAFEFRLDEYFRTDMQIIYRLNKQRCAMEWRLDIQNITNRRNGAFYYFDVVSESIQLKRQVGLIPVLSYRLEF
jgi:hypothetical protein